MDSAPVGTGVGERLLPIDSEAQADISGLCNLNRTSARARGAQVATTRPPEARMTSPVIQEAQYCRLN
jgi:hypothetical protein